MKSIFPSALVLTGLTLLLPIVGLRADWRQFRGPAGSGVAEENGVPADLQQSVAWQASLPGRGLSSPIVVGDRVFVTCASGPKQQRLHVLCFSNKDGHLLWERQFVATGRTLCHEKTCVAAPTPTSDGEHVFALFSSNDLLCLDLDGNLIWYRGLMRDYPNASNSLGMSSSLVVANGVVVAQIENDSDSFTVGVDVGTGLNRWKLSRPRMANWTSPVLIPAAQAGGQPLVALQSGKGIVAIEPATGRTVWTYDDGASTIPSSAFAGRVLYVPSHGLTALEPNNEGQSPKQLWRSNQLSPGTASPVVAGDRIYTVNNAGVLSCGETASGRRLWQLRLKGPFSATPVISGTLLYCVNEKGLAQVVDLTKPEGAVVHEFELHDVVLGTPSISGGALFVRSDRHLWKLSK